jgi:glycosyltransferase involved in cell wall biosynthesis
MKINEPDLFIGVTSWDSELFLGHCLRGIQSTTAHLKARIVVLDNVSSDRSVQIAREAGAQVLVEQCTQADALNRLLALSRSRYTLLLHADVVLLSPRWFELCASKLDARVGLVSPEDIGCGPYSRPFGAGLPESSFMLFDTQIARRTRIGRWARWHRVPVPIRSVDFYGPHVTHRLPERLNAKGYDWRRMQVHISDALNDPIYRPAFKPQVWTEELAHLRYGLGNFYSLDGEITHYHNWYDRVPHQVTPDSTETTGRNGEGFPLAFIKRYTDNFLADLTAGRLVVPAAVASGRLPKAL